MVNQKEYRKIEKKKGVFGLLNLDLSEQIGRIASLEDSHAIHNINKIKE